VADAVCPAACVFFGKIGPLTTPSGGCGISRYLAKDGRAKKKAEPVFGGSVCLFFFSVL
jgi:hypothetical protein